MKKFISQFFIN